MGSTIQLSPPLDISHHFSYSTKRREASKIKGLYKYMVPGIANIAGGMPHPSYFPYDTLEASVAHPKRFHPSGTPVQKPKPDTSSTQITIPRESHANASKKIDVATALQYGVAGGLPPMASFVRKFTRHHLHPNVPYAGGPDTILTCGATDGFSKAVEVFTNHWNPRRDSIRSREGVICEEFVYLNAISTVKVRGTNVVTVAIDEEGMLASGEGGLADVLSNWDYRNGRLPHLLYTITIGQNPTGGTLSVERRKEIYAICQQYDIIIIEDDPYWNLQYPSSLDHRATTASVDSPPLKRNYNAHGKSSGYEFLDSLVPSYLSVDTDGRVVRLDTFSKTIAPGCRLGWITAQPAVVERVARITETSTQQPSGFVQAMVAELVLGQQADDEEVSSKKKEADKGWQMDGWVRWLEGLRGGYERRMQAMCTTLDEGKYLINADHGPSIEADEQAWSVVDKTQLYDFTWPTGGMFVWVKARLDEHPLNGRYSVEKLSQAMWVHLTQKPYLCLLALGSMFSPTPETLRKSYPYYRLCFAAMPEDEVEAITLRLVNGIRTFWLRKDLDGLDLEAEDAMDLGVGIEGNMVGLGC